ncbi:MAG: DinB family protein [Bacteroidota bacterium]
MIINRAKKDEYNPFYEGYISLIPEEDVLGFIIQQHTRFVDYLTSLGQGNLKFTYANGKWTRAQVIGHIIDTERVMAYRALCIAKGDKVMLPGFDQDVYMEHSNFESRTKESLIKEFDHVRSGNIEMFCSWGDEQFSQIGNANGSKCSVPALMSIIAGHLEHHLNILKERYI